jgi:hypothetical protein
MATQKNQLEIYFEWYINELKEAGFIKIVKREAFPILVSDAVEKERYDFSTKKPRLQKYKLFQQNTYTFDYIIIWEKHAKEIFYNLLNDNDPVRIYCPFYAMVDKQGEHVSFVDVKPPAGAMIFGNNTTGYTFPILQKIIYTIYGIYVNKSIPIPLMSKGTVKSGNKTALFLTTFVPKRYLLTDGGMQGREIKYKKQSLQEYVNYKNKEIIRINSLFNEQKTLL